MATTSDTLKMFDSISKAMDGINRQLKTFTSSMKQVRTIAEKPIKMKLDVAKFNKTMTQVEKNANSIKPEIGYNSGQVTKTANEMRKLLENTIGTITSKIELKLPSTEKANLLGMLNGLFKSAEQSNRQIKTLITTANQLRTNLLKPIKLALDVAKFKQSLSQAEKSAKAIKLVVGYKVGQVKRTANEIRKLLEKTIGTVTGKVQLKLPNAIKANLLGLFNSLVKAAEQSNRRIKTVLTTVNQLRTTVSKSIKLNLDLVKFKQALSQAEKSVKAIKPKLSYNAAQVKQTAVNMRVLIEKTIGKITAKITLKLPSTERTNANKLFSSLSQSATKGNQQIKTLNQSINSLRTNAIRPIKLTLDLAKFKQSLSRASKSAQATKLKVSYDAAQVKQTAKNMRKLLEDSIGKIKTSICPKVPKAGSKMSTKMPQADIKGSEQIKTLNQMFNTFKTNAMKPIKLTLDVAKFKQALSQAEKSAKAIKPKISFSDSQIKRTANEMRKLLEKTIEAVTAKIELKLPNTAKTNLLGMFNGLAKAAEQTNRQIKTLLTTINQLRTTLSKPIKLLLDLVKFKQALSQAEKSLKSVKAKISYSAEQVKQTAVKMRNLLEKSIGKITAKITLKLPSAERTNASKMFSSMSQAATKASQQIKALNQEFKSLRTSALKPIKLTLDLTKFKQSLSQAVKRAQAVKIKIGYDINQVIRTATRIRNLLTKHIGQIPVKLAPGSKDILKGSKTNQAKQNMNKATDCFKCCECGPNKGPGSGKGSGSGSSSSAGGDDAASDGNSGSIGFAGKMKNTLASGFGKLKDILGKHVFNADQFKSLISSGISATDQYTNLHARLQTINDSMQTTEDLQNKIFAASNRSRANYQQMAGFISDISLASPGAFASNDESIQFAEAAQKAVKLGGKSESDQQAGMNTVGNIMKKGVMSKDDFTAIMTTAPDIAEAISSYTGTSIADLQKLAAEGQLTSMILKNSMLNATDSINEKFSDLPVTFSSIGEVAKNTIFEAIGPALAGISSKLDEAFKSGSLNTFINMVAAGFNLIASIGMWAFDLIINNLDIVKNVLAAIGIAALVAGMAMFFAWLQPLLPLLLIIGIIYLIITILNMFGISTGEVLGFVAGLFMMLFAVIWNIVAAVWNALLSFVEFLVNLFIDPIYTVQKLIYDLTMYFGEAMYDMLVGAENFASGFKSMILGAINGIIGGINGLLNGLKDMFGIDLGQINPFEDEGNPHAMSDAFRKKLDAIEEPTTDKDPFSLDKYKMEEKDPIAAFNKGFEGGSSLGDGIGSLTDLFGGGSAKGDLFGGFPPGGGNDGGTPDNIANVDRVGEVGSINNTVDISSEDLKMMRELAEMNNIQNFVSLTPSINFGDMHVRRDSDIDIIVAKISDRLNQDIATSVDAAYGG
ncbi:hypothetical protein J40TS1_40270 [Paenibacillus montaniterrae]|uniref:Tape measure protein N-terminal domain-containing protein n=1 Tax=Paenibacillus montaniterrae TaxID=429341 RepID=A0A919YS10_9BACL|nr:tape measure protein [Paenibacillus montaniterrae]GIP18385.1 hypothetical protein J40TS1_40270 [Paenibacillus montaniterrae]